MIVKTHSKRSNTERQIHIIKKEIRNTQEKDNLQYKREAYSKPPNNQKSK
jgi:hypothetical protein